MALATYAQRGESLDYKNTGDTKIEANTIVVYGSKIGVTGCDIDPGEIGTIHVMGVFEMPKADATAIDAGAAVYWDATNNGITATAGSNVIAGFAAYAAAAADTTVIVKINA